MLSGEWEVREEMRLRELEEARARAAQMEKTMRWWSDCTANWREKWSKVRTERNRARDEGRQYRMKLDGVSKESHALRRERQELLTELDKLQSELEDFRCGHVEKQDGLKSPSVNGVNPSVNANVNANVTPGVNVAKTDVSTQSTLERLGGGKREQADKSNHTTDSLPKSAPPEGAACASSSSPRESSEGSEAAAEASSGRTVAMLRLKLDEAKRTVGVEREERSKLSRKLEQAEVELTEMRARTDELKQLKDEAVKEVSAMRDEHRDVVGKYESDLEDETVTRIDMDRKLTDLRKELERLQGENATEWGLRERLETEKLALERENKQLRAHIDDMEEEIDHKCKQLSASQGADVKELQTQIQDKSKEVSDVKHSYHKAKKLLHDTSTELQHATRRAEQYELEVKKLRSRIDELKNDLARAEDEVDNHGNLIRKLQRGNDELSSERENLQLQVEHLKSRLRRAGSQPMLIKSRSSSLKSFELDDDSHEEGASSGDDVDDAPKSDKS